MNSFRRIVSILLALSIMQPASGQDKATIKTLDSLLRSYHQYDALNGNVLIAKNGVTIYNESFGLGNIEWSMKNTVDTRFRLASLSKNITVALCFLLCQEGKLKLDDTVSKYLPEFPNGKNITIDHLLTHRSGLIDHRNMRSLYDNVYGMGKLSRIQMLEVFKDSALLFEPGTKWKYSNFGYNLLAVIVEKIMNKPFDEVLKEKIFLPAKMLRSTTMENNTVVDKLSSRYETTFGEIVLAQYYDGSMMAGAGSVISTVEDVYAFFHAINSGTLLNNEFRKKFNGQWLRDENNALTGYNTWSFYQKTNLKDSTLILYRSGNHFGTHTLVYESEGDGIMLVILLNMRSAQLFNVADNILNVLYSQKFEWPKDTYVRWLAKDIRQFGVDHGIARFRNNKRRYGEHWSHNPRDLNRLGYYFLDKGDYDIAIKVFQLNLEYFPNESDFFDSLGEAFMKKGNTNQAIEAFKTALKMNPNNEHAKELLESLQGK